MQLTQVSLSKGLLVGRAALHKEPCAKQFGRIDVRASQAPSRVGQILRLEVADARHCRHRIRGELLRVRTFSTGRLLSRRRHCRRSVSGRVLLHLHDVQLAVETTIIEHADGLTIL